jgi:Ni,Fe-hydrogenase maturation factor
LVVDAIAKLDIAELHCRKLRSPIEAIDWFSEEAEIHLVDAAADLPAAVISLDYANATDHERLQTSRPRGTHDFGLLETLRLAETLEQLPGRITIWLVAAEAFSPMAELSATAAAGAQTCAERLAAVLRDRQDHRS